MRDSTGTRTSSRILWRTDLRRKLIVALTQSVRNGLVMALTPEGAEKPPAADHSRAGITGSGEPAISGQSAIDLPPVSVSGPPGFTSRAGLPPQRNHRGYATHWKHCKYERRSWVSAGGKPGR